jgi:hypothetical protein
VTVPELLALPIGQRVIWGYDPHAPVVAGEVVGRTPEGSHIRWDDGQEFIVSPDDNDLAEFAGTLACAANRPRMVNLPRGSAPGRTALGGHKP